MNKDKAINEAIERLNGFGVRLNPQDEQVRSVLELLFLRGERSGMAEEQESRRGVSWQEATA